MGETEDLMSIFIEAYRASGDVESFAKLMERHGIWMNRNAANGIFRYFKQTRKKPGKNRRNTNRVLSKTTAIDLPQQT